MSLLKSLICFKGFDNGLRYLLITGCCYLLMIILSSALAKAAILLILLLLISLPILLASAIRRVRDGSLAQALAFATPLMFLSCVLAITYSQSTAVWFLMLPALLISLATGFLNNPKVRKKNIRYVLGYSGPVDLSQNSSSPQKHHSFHARVEPTLASGSIPEVLHADSHNTGSQNLYDEINQNNNINQQQFELKDELNPAHQFSSTYSPNSQSVTASNWQQNLNEWFADNTKIKVLSLLTLLIVILIIASFVFETKPTDEIIDKPVVEEIVKQRSNKIEMPDNFWIMHDEHDAITLGWQGDIREDGNIWSAKTALGDEACAELSFSRNDKFRSLKVSVKNQGDYYADFSPIDTQAIVQAIGLKSKFNLCGYEFSLKGTQAKLMNNKKYSGYFEE